MNNSFRYFLISYFHISENGQLLAGNLTTVRDTFPSQASLIADIKKEVLILGKTCKQLVISNIYEFANRDDYLKWNSKQ